MLRIVTTRGRPWDIDIPSMSFCRRLEQSFRAQYMSYNEVNGLYLFLNRYVRVNKNKEHLRHFIYAIHQIKMLFK